MINLLNNMPYYGSFVGTFKFMSLTPVYHYNRYYYKRLDPGKTCYLLSLTQLSVILNLLFQPVLTGFGLVKVLNSESRCLSHPVQ